MIVSSIMCESGLACVHVCIVYVHANPTRTSGYPPVYWKNFENYQILMKIIFQLCNTLVGA